MLLVASLTFFSISAFQSLRGWEMALEGARGHTQNHVLMLEGNARQVLTRVKVLLLRAEAATSGRKTIVTQRQHLEALLPDDRLVQSLFLLDRHGNEVVTTEKSWAERNKSHAAMDYFTRHAAEATDRELVFGSPRATDENGPLLLPVSRRVSDSKGRFAGVIVAMVPASYFQRFYDSVAEQDKGVASMFSTAGDVWVASQSFKTWASPWAANRAAFMKQIFSWPMETVTNFVAGSGEKWVFSHRTMIDFPFVVAYGLPRSVILSSWKSTVMQNVLLLLLANAVLGGAMVILNRKERLHREAKDSLHKSETLFRSLTESIPDGIVRIDPECRHLFMNAAAIRLFGLEGLNPLGQTLREIFPHERDETWEPLWSSVQRVVDRAAPDTLEFASPNGSIMEVRHFPEFDAQGHVASVLGIALDITERKRAEQALAQRERQFRTLAENTPDNVVRHDTMGRSIYKNAATYRTLGNSAQPMQGKTPGESIPASKSFVVEYEKKLRQVLSTGEPATLTADLDFGPLQGRVHHVLFVPECDEAGIVVGAITIGRDISELKRREWELEQSRDMLRELVVRNVTTREDERKNIARELHDELGQVLTALRLDIATLRLQYNGDATISLRCERLLGLVDATIRTVRNILLSLRPSVLDMGLAPALEWLVSDILKRNGIQCSLCIESDFADTDEAQLVGIFRIVQESLTNILRHATAQNVFIQLKKQEEKLNVTIRDDGIGFDYSSVLGKSFGLVGICERALMMGGSARIDSESGRGTVIQVELPLPNVMKSMSEEGV